jgi:hypothetical protein
MPSTLTDRQSARLPTHPRLVSRATLSCLLRGFAGVAENWPEVLIPASPELLIGDCPGDYDQRNALAAERKKRLLPLGLVRKILSLTRRSINYRDRIRA